MTVALPLDEESHIPFRFVAFVALCFEMSSIFSLRRRGAARLTMFAISFVTVHTIDRIASSS